MKHKHYEEMKQWIEDVEGHVVLAKSQSDWFITTTPNWVDWSGYKVIPRRHLKVALAFLNDGAAIQGALNGEWVDLDAPAWSPNYDYRIKPKKVKRTIIWDTAGQYVTQVVLQSSKGITCASHLQVIEIEVDE